VRKLVLLLLVGSCCAQVALKGTIALKGTVTVTGATLNNFASRSAGINIPGGLSSLITANDLTSAVVPESFNTAMRHDTGGVITARGVCANGGNCDNTTGGVFEDSEIPGADDLALALTLPAGASPDAGNAHTNISVGPNFTFQFDGTTGKKEFFYQYQLYLGPKMLDVSNWPGSEGFKTSIWTEGVRTGVVPGSCSGDPSEIVVNQYLPACDKKTLTLYATCGVNDHVELFLPSTLETLINAPTGCPYYGDKGIPCDSSRCWEMQEGEWFTVQVHGVINGFGSTNFVNTLEMWLAHQGQPSVLVQNAIDFPFYGLTAGHGWGMMWFLPYMTGVTSAPSSSYMGWDNFFVSKRRLPDPGTGVPNAPDSLSLTIVDTTHVTVNWRNNSQNGTAQDDTAASIERCTGNAVTCWANQSFSQIGTAAAGATSYADSGLTHTQAYTYRVRLSNAYGNSAYAASICQNTSTNPCGSTATP
jgi:hypothetical protein